MKRWIAWLERQIFFSRSQWMYVLMAAIGLAPLIVAVKCGLSDNVVLEQSGDAAFWFAYGRDDGNSRTAVGYAHRFNWMLYPLMLPLALLVARSSISIIYQAPRQDIVRYRAFIEALRRSRRSPVFGWALLGAVLINVAELIQVVPRVFVENESDLEGIMQSLWKAKPQPLDWGWYANLGLVSWQDIAAVEIFALLAQGAIAALAIGYVLLVRRFNISLMDAIYVRHRFRQGRIYYELPVTQSGDHKFGLGLLHPAFSAQMLFGAGVGLFVMVSRLEHVRTPGSDSVAKVIEGVWSVVSGKGHREVELSLVDLVPDAGQWILLVGWFWLLVVLCIPARIKFLPRRHSEARSNSEKYIEEFLPEGQRCLNAHFEGFRRQNFWPQGDRRAFEGLCIALIVAFWIIFPFWPTSMATWSAVVIIIAMAVATTKGLLWLNQHRLCKVGPELDSSCERRRART